MRLTMSMADERAVDFGTFLRQAREKRGLTLQQVAVTTRISARVLDALERNDPTKLPGGIFSRAFVRSYAREVGLDPEAAVASFVAAFPEDSGAADVPVTTTAEQAESYVSHRRVATTAVKLLGAIALIAVLGLIGYMAAQRARGPAAPQGRERPVVAEPAPQVTVPAPAPSSTAAAPLVVGLSATESCWVSVTVDGTRTPARTLGAGERVEFPVNRSITLTVGNAGAVDVSLNGKPARPLGGPGKVVTATIAADAFASYLR